MSNLEKTTVCLTDDIATYEVHEYKDGWMGFAQDKHGGDVSACAFPPGAIPALKLLLGVEMTEAFVSENERQLSAKIVEREVSLRKSQDAYDTIHGVLGEQADRIALLESQRDELVKAVDAIKAWVDSKHVKGPFSIAYAHGMEMSDEGKAWCTRTWLQVDAAIERAKEGT